jgi:RHS repeat-associated protein
MADFAWSCRKIEALKAAAKKKIRMATTTELSEKPHQGFEGFKAALYPASMEDKSNTASGLPVWLWRNGTGSRSSGKERDETGLDYFGARYYSGPHGRFTSVDPLYFQAGMLSDPQRFNLYAYARNNPLKFVDPTGREIELIGTEEEREKMLIALQSGSHRAGEFLKVKTRKTFFGLGETRYFIEVTDKKAFAESNAVAKTLIGMIEDKDKLATLRFVDEGTKVLGITHGSVDDGHTPGLTFANHKMANITITRGELGNMPAQLMEDGRPSKLNLAQVVVHELGHVNTTWYHGSIDTNGTAVRIENQVRKLQGVPLRIGHDRPGDVRLAPSE